MGKPGSLEDVVSRHSPVVDQSDDRDLSRSIRVRRSEAHRNQLCRKYCHASETQRRKEQAEKIVTTSAKMIFSQACSVFLAETRPHRVQMHNAVLISAIS